MNVIWHVNRVHISLYETKKTTGEPACGLLYIAPPRRNFMKIIQFAWVAGIAAVPDVGEVALAAVAGATVVYEAYKAYEGIKEFVETNQSAAPAQAPTVRKIYPKFYAIIPIKPIKFRKR